MLEGKGRKKGALALSDEKEQRWQRAGVAETDIESSFSEEQYSTRLATSAATLHQLAPKLTSLSLVHQNKSSRQFLKALFPSATAKES